MKYKAIFVTFFGNSLQSLMSCDLSRRFLGKAYLCHTDTQKKIQLKKRESRFLAI